LLGPGPLKSRAGVTQFKLPGSIVAARYRCFGGGLSIAGALTPTGLADWIDAQLAGLSALREFFIILISVFAYALVPVLTAS